MGRITLGDDEVLKYCGYCNSNEIFKIRAEYTQNLFGKTGPRNYATAWRILECTSCSKLILGETYAIYGPFNCADEIIYYDAGEEIIIYPVPEPAKYLEPLPQEIEKARKVALTLKDVEPNACAVQVGRTLEIVCNYENAQGKSLAYKLEYLFKNGRIPEQLSQMAKQLKELRNLGAHADKDNDEVNEVDIPVMLEFLDAILEYLYVAPAKIAKVQARFDKKT